MLAIQQIGPLRNTAPSFFILLSVAWVAKRDEVLQINSTTNGKSFLIKISGHAHRLRALRQKTALNVLHKLLSAQSHI
jgi:hypothetical protein